MKNNLIYLYPSQSFPAVCEQENESSIRKIGRVISKTIEIFAAIGIFLCVGVCTLLFFTML